MVPETDQNRALKLDIIGIGCLAYEMLTEEVFTEASLSTIQGYLRSYEVLKADEDEDNMSACQLQKQ
jgi:hypothetical protein